MSDQPIVHAFDDAGRILQEAVTGGMATASSLRDKLIAELHTLPIDAEMQHIGERLAAVMHAHEAAAAEATSQGQNAPGQVETQQAQTAAPAEVTQPEHPPAV